MMAREGDGRGARDGLSRRSLLQFCAAMAATMGLPAGAGQAMAETLSSGRKPSVIWLPLQECTGCTEALLRAEHPTIDRLMLEMVSLDYQETLFAAAGHQAEAARREAMEANKGRYILVVDGSVPTADGGIYCKIGGKTALELLAEAAEGAAAVIAIGSCAAWGGMPSTGPNPTGAVGIGQLVQGKPVVNLPGCPPSPYNFLSTVTHYLTFGKLPELDAQGRPKFAYSRLIHENCERRPHFDAGRFAVEFGDAGHRQGWCLYRLGCKGPETYANCPSILFNDIGAGSWPVGTGHPCIGCAEAGVGFAKPIHALAEVKSVTGPASYPRIVEEQGNGATVGAAALAAGAVGVALGAGVATARKLARTDKRDAPPAGKE